ncbi:MAG: hypothetical protein N3B13_08475, partial [Deltaproteobacteria bacterium]|nr:hypothetical protein [Deltaproteobacteria bacterium]
LIKKMLSYIQIMPDILEQREAIRITSDKTGIEEDVIYSYLKGSFKEEKITRQLNDARKFKSYEIWLISILIQFPNLVENLPDNTDDMIESEEIAEAFRDILAAYRAGKVSAPYINDSSIYSEVTEVMMNKTFPDNESDAFSILIDCIHRLQIDKLKREIKEIDQNISRAKASGDEKLIDNLIKRKLELSKSIQLREIKYG